MTYKPNPPKPSANKTGWEKEWDKTYGKYLDDMDDFVWKYYPKAKSTNPSMKNFIRQLLASELAREREKVVQEVRKRTQVIKVEDPYGNWHNTKPTLEAYILRVENALTQAAKKVSGNE